MIIHNVIQKTTEWHLLRSKRLTGSHAQAIANGGDGLKTYIDDKIVKLIDPDIDFFYGKQMKKGEELEPIARKAYEFETGNEVTEVGFCSSEYGDEVNTDMCGISPDGFVGNDGMVEYKSRNHKLHLSMLRTKKIDSKTLWQIQMGLLVVGRKWCDSVSYNPRFNDSLCIIRIVRIEEMIKKLKFGISRGSNLLLNELEDPIIMRQLKN